MRSRTGSPCLEPPTSSTPRLPSSCTVSTMFRPHPTREPYDDSEYIAYHRRDTYNSYESSRSHDMYMYDHNAPSDLYGSYPRLSPVSSPPLLTPPPAQDTTDSEGDPYGPRYTPSVESIGPSRSMPQGPSTTHTDFPPQQQDSYPAWSPERQIPLSKEEIEDVFLDLAQKFGFQRDSMRNMVGPFLSMPVVRSPGLSPVRLLHAAPRQSCFPHVPPPRPPHLARGLHRRRTCKLSKMVLRCPARSRRRSRPFPAPRHATPQIFQHHPKPLHQVSPHRPRPLAASHEQHEPLRPCPPDRPLSPHLG